ncbi:hypothetical protein [Chryseobacterium sp. ERMR1:04]|uniref:hypothetical protein n=1 Tax=Chryseobacterium sp. ERMR1:04 TaxID=1705393 RepID=UPI0006C863A1|nr:hypothetical protein [Chryseobacterium sp. ERMR1:04]KPH14165.1 hypothetical protein AMQ68_01155 [Chryseobacterium sp. ERMR1:04]
MNIKKVTVLNAQGFIGSQVAKEFKNRGYQVETNLENYQNFNISEQPIEVRHQKENGRILISMSIPLKQEKRKINTTNFKKKFIFNNNNFV